ncbi:MAG: hypothetical protein Q7T33_11830 [Dehalococcoidia bacterium]|nr:hypothetical protein [Dehalococcoidia bacterium]
MEDAGAKDLVGSAAGQIVGRMNSVWPVREVIYDMAQEFMEATERLEQSLAAGVQDR